jgi:hypothetical protein
MAMALALAAGTACSRGKRGPPPEAGRDFGAAAISGAPGPVDARPLLALARTVVEHRDRAPASPSPSPSPSSSSSPSLLPARRVFLAAWPASPLGGTGAPLAVTTALGPTLGDAVAAAAEALVVKLPDAAHARLELDVTTGVDAMSLDEDVETPVAAIGLEGVLAIRDDGKVGAVLPGEVAQRALYKGSPFRLDHLKLRGALSERSGIADPDLPSARAYRFRADAFVESPERDGALPIFRGMVAHPPAAPGATSEAMSEALLAAVRRGADYLCRVMNDQGKYVYMYHPTDDRDDASYGWLRHAGATYALLEAYDEFGTPLYLEKAERALTSLGTHLVDAPSSQGKYVVDTNDEEQQKSGGAGLALLAFAKHAAVSGKRNDLETMRALARFIIAEQFADGHFRDNADLQSESGKKLKREPVYYQGEAALGLLRLDAVDPQPSYVEAARKAADFVVKTRDVDVSQDNQEHDHWITYVFNDLYRLVPDDAYIEHAYKIARAILNKQHRAGNSPEPDWIGTFYEGQTTPGATRLEAYAADVALSRFAGRPDAWLVEPAREVAASMLGQQFRPDNAYWLKNPAKAEGGVRESLIVQDVRIDYVQHAMSGWLHLARALRDPAYGKTGVPSQDPVRPQPGAL